MDYDTLVSDKHAAPIVGASSSSLKQSRHTGLLCRMVHDRTPIGQGSFLT